MIIHFFWSGQNFHFANALAVRTAVAVHRPEQVVIWHGEIPCENPWWKDAVSHPEVVLRDCSNLVAASSPQNHSDYVSYHALFEYGGLYLDFDTVSVRPVAQYLTDDVDLVASGPHRYDDERPDPTRCERQWICVGVLLARQRCRFLERILDAASLKVAGSYGDAGSRLVTAEYYADPERVRLLPTQYFGPFECWNWRRCWQDLPVPDDLYVLHYFGKQAHDQARHVVPNDQRQTLYHRAVKFALGRDYFGCESTRKS